MLQNLLGHHSTACVLLCLGPVPLYLDSLSDSCAPCMCASPWDPCPWFATSLCYSRAPCSRLTLPYPHLLIFCLHMLKICLLLQIRGLVLTTWSVDSMCCVHLCCTHLCCADDLDVLFVKQDSQWDVFVQTQRDTLVHRPKRRKRD